MVSGISPPSLADLFARAKRSERAIVAALLERRCAWKRKAGGQRQLAYFQQHSRIRSISICLFMDIPASFPSSPQRSFVFNDIPASFLQKNLFGSPRSVESRHLVVRASQRVTFADCDGSSLPGQAKARRRVWWLQGASVPLILASFLLVPRRLFTRAVARASCPCARPRWPWHVLVAAMPG